MKQEVITLFDHIDEEPVRPEEDPAHERDIGDWCLVYLVTQCGGNSGNLFVLHREDAIKLCSDECSHGVARGGRWMFNWTSLEHFYDSKDASKADRQMRNVHGDLEPFVFIRDTGKQDKDFERLGIHKPGIWEVENILRSIGYRMEYKGIRSEIEAGNSVLTEEDLEQTEKEIRDIIKRRKQTCRTVSSNP